MVIATLLWHHLNLVFLRTCWDQQKTPPVGVGECVFVESVCLCLSMQQDTLQSFVLIFSRLGFPGQTVHHDFLECVESLCIYYPGNKGIFVAHFFKLGFQEGWQVLPAKTPFVEIHLQCGLDTSLSLSLMFVCLFSFISIFLWLGNMLGSKKGRNEMK